MDSNVLCLNLQLNGRYVDGQASGGVVHYNKVLAEKPTDILTTVTAEVTPSTVTPPISTFDITLTIDYATNNKKRIISCIKLIGSTSSIIQSVEDNHIEGNNCEDAFVSKDGDKNIKLKVDGVKNNFNIKISFLLNNGDDYNCEIGFAGNSWGKPNVSKSN